MIQHLELDMPIYALLMSESCHVMIFVAVNMICLFNDLCYNDVYYCILYHLKYSMGFLLSGRIKIQMFIAHSLKYFLLISVDIWDDIRSDFVFWKMRPPKTCTFPNVKDDLIINLCTYIVCEVRLIFQWIVLLFNIFYQFSHDILLCVISTLKWCFAMLEMKYLGYSMSTIAKLCTLKTCVQFVLVEVSDEIVMWWN